MPRLTRERVEEMAREMWQGPGSITLSLPSHECVFTHSSGKQVEVTLTVGMIALPEAQFRQKILEPMLAQLHREVGN